MRVGTGYLAYGSFSNIGSSAAAGLAYYDGKVWSVPEGVGLYSYNAASTNPRIEVESSASSANAATVIGNDVYLYGSFNQVGLIRGNVAGFVKLTWSEGGVFTIGTVGNGYSQSGPTGCTSFCPRDSQPSGTTYKLKSYTLNNVITFVMRVDGDIYTFSPNFASWTRISSSNGARFLQGNIRDFDINGNSIYVVGKFDNTADAEPTRAYLHIAVTADAGTTWTALTNPQPLPLANFAALPAIVTNGTTTFIALDCIGLNAIVVESPQSIYVAGGWRETERNVSINNLAGQMQNRVFQIVGPTTNVISQRFGVTNSANYGTYPQFLSSNFIDSLTLNNGVLYAYGSFEFYNQITNNGIRFTNRYTTVIKGAAKFTNNQWTQAFGGFLTTSSSGDVSATNLASVWNTNGDVAYFLGTSTSSTLQSSYNLVSGSLFGYGGEKKRNQDRRWNNFLGHQRFTSSRNFANGPGIPEGFVRTLHYTQRGESIVFGGTFDYIGDVRVAGIGWYRYESQQFEAVGGGLYQVTSNSVFGVDNFANNRFGGDVYDIEERGDYLYAAGQFNRNNTGNALYNIARVKFRSANSGWDQLDGGCDSIVRDLLIVGDTLYATGDFNYCGLITDTVNGPFRGRVQASRIARINLNEKNPSWRSLGVGLNDNGYALAWRKGYLYVGGDFTQAGGLHNTTGIARWRNDHWEDVVARCRSECNNPHNIWPYATPRLPGNCYNLRELSGRVYCADNNNFISYWDGTYWYRAVGVTTPTYKGLSNTLIVRNATENNYILFSSTLSSDEYTSNGANLATFDNRYSQLVPTYGGFSKSPNAFSSANSLIASTFLIAVIIVSYLF